jgi:thiol:disulfide interchange protein DsbA
MKRITITVLNVFLMIMLNACSQKDQTTEVSATAPTVAAAIASNESTPTPVAADTATDPGADQLSEFGAATSDSTDNSTPLALKISEMPTAPASRWKEGMNYKLVVPAQPTTAKPGQVEVAEVFWYGCPHCLALDPYLESWRKNSKASFVSFVRVPVMWGAIHRAHARVFYTAELLGKLDTLHTSIFSEIQGNHDPLQEPAQVQAFFTSKGIALADFQKVYSSFGVEAALKQAEALGLRYKVESVPLIIINGKYMTDVGMAGGHEQLISLINELVAREHGVRA